MTGEILINSQTVNEIEPRDRDIAMVFQNHTLYPHMSLFENTAFRCTTATVDLRLDLVRSHLFDTASGKALAQSH